MRNYLKIVTLEVGLRSGYHLVGYVAVANQLAAWASKAGGRENASPPVEKSAWDVPPEIMIFQYLFS